MDQKLPSAEAFFPFWNELTYEQQSDLENFSSERIMEKGSIIIPSRENCLGLILVQDGRLRSFMISEEGKEVTLYRLYEYDICLFSAACVMKNIQFDIHIEAEKDTRVLIVPTVLYKRLVEQSIAFSNYTNQLLSARFSDVMWTLEQILFKNMDSRIAQALLGQYYDEGTTTLAVTHEAIARDLGTAREVVTRILKYFKGDGMIELSRGKIELTDIKRLEALVG